MKLLEIVDMMDIKGQVWFKFFYKKRGSGASVNKKLTEELRKPVIKKSKGEKSMWDLKTIFWQQI